MNFPAITTEIAALCIVMAGIPVMATTILPGARAFAGRLFLVGVVVLLVAAVVPAGFSWAARAFSAVSWWWLLPVFVVAPMVAVALLLRSIVWLAGLLFGRAVGERVAAHVAGALFLKRVAGHRGRQMPELEPPDDWDNPPNH
jgi:hypothetical protein